MLNTLGAASVMIVKALVELEVGAGIGEFARMS